MIYRTMHLCSLQRSAGVTERGSDILYPGEIRPPGNKVATECLRSARILVRIMHKHSTIRFLLSVCQAFVVFVV